MPAVALTERSPISILLSDANRVRLGRYHQIARSLRRHLPILSEPVLDFGCGNGLSTFALMEFGITNVLGVEPGRARVDVGQGVLSKAGEDPARLLHVSDTQRLPFPDECFGTVLAQAVFEHIPQPRHGYIAEVWRVLRPGGHLIIEKTPNKYLPYDRHATHRWFVSWLPRNLAYRYARARGWPKDWNDWVSSGWRGLGHYELTSALLRGSFEYLPERTRPRHRALHRLGLPAGLLDPYPLWVLRRRS